MMNVCLILSFILERSAATKQGKGENRPSDKGDHNARQDLHATTDLGKRTPTDAFAPTPPPT